MGSILVSPRNKEELRLLSDLLEKMNIISRVFSEEQLEDTGLGLLLRDADRNQKVSRQEIMQKLEAN